MLLSNSAFLTQDPDRVYGFLLDLDAVAPCIPGASLGPADTADTAGSREATVLVRLGPMRFTYSGAVTILDSDPPARRAVLQVDAREASGAGTARALITLSVLPTDDPPGARIDIDNDLSLSGGAAQTGRGMIEAVAEEMLEDFRDALTERLEAEPARLDDESSAAQPATAPSQQHLGFRLVWRIVRRWLRQGVRSSGRGTHR
jgi:carbon monoxide dehydrogenase subunit G